MSSIVKESRAENRQNEVWDEGGELQPKEHIEFEERDSGIEESSCRGDIPPEIYEDLEKHSDMAEVVEPVGTIPEGDFKIIEAEHQEITDVREVYEMAKANEAQISKDVVEAVSGSEGHLEGFSQRIKSPESYERKVSTIAEEAEVSPEQAAESINDIIRYTEVADGEHLAGEFHRTLDELESKGYSVQKVKNTWLDKEVAYKGVNVVVESPEGQTFEMQYHTPESYATKERMHFLYEEYRLPSTNRHRRRELYQEMKRISQGLRPPKDVGRMIR